MKPISQTPQQARATLERCSEQLAYIVKRSQEAAPHSRHVDPARVGGLTEVVIHAVLSLRGMPDQSGYYRSRISRAYASGVGRAPHTPTVDSVKTIIAVLGEAIGQLNGEQTAPLP